MSTYQTYDDSNEADEAFQQQDEKNLSLPILLAVQLNSIINISSREFHKGIVLYTDGGMVKGYLPDVLESYCNAVRNLAIILSAYDKTIFEAIKGKNFNDVSLEAKRIFFDEQYSACVCLVKKLGLLPDEGQDRAEIAGRKRKEPKKEEGEE